MDKIPSWTSRLADLLYDLRDPVRSCPVPMNPVTVICVSDTHNQQPEIPNGDLLLHAGDLTAKGTFKELQNQIDWLDKQPHQYKVVIAGELHRMLFSINNFPLTVFKEIVTFFLLDPIFVGHSERIIERPGSSRSDLQWKSVIYLQDQSFVADFPNGRQLKIYGSPWTPRFGSWDFQYSRIRDIFEGVVVPPNTDILLTHGPPKFCLDSEASNRDLNLRCSHLLKEIWRVRNSLKLVVFGHIHGGYGTKTVRYDQVQRMYDSIYQGASGILGLLLMTLSLLWSGSSQVIGIEANDGQQEDTVQMANAAAQPAWRDFDQKQPLIFLI